MNIDKSILRAATLILICPSITLFAVPAVAHQDHCSAIIASIEQAGFTDNVDISCNDNYAVISSDTYPDHEMMTGIVGTNEQVPVPAQYSAPIRLTPQLGSTPQTRDAALGVAVNGTPIYDYTAGGEMSQEDLHHHQAKHDTLQSKQLDRCGGHAGRGDDYHYHVQPTCMIEQMQNKSDDAIIGWAFDGFPIYGPNNPDGTSIDDAALDVCNGQTDPVYGYRYHTSPDSPYIIQCLMGEVDSVHDLPRVPPLKSIAGGPGAPNGKPPRGGVEDLTFTDDGNGTRRMEYRYRNEDYFIEYSDTERNGCYSFKSRTVTNEGVISSGVYCR